MHIHSHRLITSVLFIVLLSAGVMVAQDIDLKTTPVAGTFDETVDAVRQGVATQGMMVLGEINQGKILSMTGLDVNVTSLFIGNPQIGNKLFSEHTGAGIAVPIRVTIYEKESGETVVSYIRPSQQLALFEGKVFDDIGQKMDKALRDLTQGIKK